VEVAAVLASGLGYGAAWSALGATMLAALSGPIYMSSIMSRYYNVGKASGSTLRFNISGENGFDFGAGLGCLFAAVIVFVGGGTIWLPLVGLAGCAACYLALQRFAETAR
jgi:hypothetical protein